MNYISFSDFDLDLGNNLLDVPESDYSDSIRMDFL
jgi:hypothetical protein